MPPGPKRRPAAEVDLSRGSSRFLRACLGRLAEALGGELETFGHREERVKGIGDLIDGGSVLHCGDRRLDHFSGAFGERRREADGGAFALGDAPGSAADGCLTSTDASGASLASRKETTQTTAPITRYAP